MTKPTKPASIKKQTRKIKNNLSIDPDRVRYQIAKDKLYTYRNDPVFFARDVLGFYATDIQKIILELIRDNNRVAVRSCHGIGKSTICSVAAMWRWFCWVCYVITTAPTARQVDEVIWKEIRGLHLNSIYNLPGRLLPRKSELIINPKRKIIGISSSDYDDSTFQGMHQKYLDVFADEAVAIAQAVFDGIKGVVSGKHNKLIMIANPTRADGYFYHACKSKYFATRKYSAYDTYNFKTYGITEAHIISGEWESMIPDEYVYPSLVNPHWVAERIEEGGSKNPYYVSRVLAEFPMQGPQSVFRLDLIENAIYRAEEIEEQETSPCAIAVDPAYGGDKTAIFYRIGNTVTKYFSGYTDDTDTIVNLVVKCAREIGQYSPIIYVDSVGVGIGVYDGLTKFDYLRVVKFNGGESAVNREQFLNLRAESFFNLAKNLETNKKLRLVDCDALLMQLPVHNWEASDAGRTKIESKEKIKKKLGNKSPDEADAVSMLFSNVQVSNIDSFGTASTANPSRRII